MFNNNTFKFIEKTCLSLDKTTVDVKWKIDCCFSISAKMYCVAVMQEPFAFSFKVTPDEYEHLIQIPGIISAPYVGRYKWVLCQENHPLTNEQVEYFIKQSYDLVKAKLPKKKY
jgi:predicted DNA-binding protein (MmcQ/YjbR family)